MEQEQAIISDSYCVFELITPRIEAMRLVVVDDLIKTEDDFSEMARHEPDFDAARWLRYERHVASLALANIESNIRKLVKRPEIRAVHLSELSAEVVEEFDPDAIVLSGT